MLAEAGNCKYSASDLVRPYVPGAPFHVFVDLDSRISSYYDEVWDTVVDHSNRRLGRYIFELGRKIAFRDIFYAIDLVYENDPSAVIDIGSGDCFWKKWFPNIYAVDSREQGFAKPDELAQVDDRWCEANANKFDDGININGARTNYDNFLQDVFSQMRLVKDRCLFTVGGLSYNRTWGYDSANYGEHIEHLMDQVFELSEHFDLVMLDVPWLRGVPIKELLLYSYLNGNIRFIFAHK